MIMSETKNDTPTPKAESSTIFYSEDGKKFEIREVWASNLDEEMKNIREVLEKYPYVAMVRIVGVAKYQKSVIVCLLTREL
jgi:hypothetical protein